MISIEFERLKKIIPRKKRPDRVVEQAIERYHQEGILDTARLTPEQFKKVADQLFGRPSSSPKKK